MTVDGIESPHLESLLSALEFQGAKNDCGPFTTATVINALCGTRMDPNILAREMNRPRMRGMIPVVRRIPNWATFPWGMVDVFKDHGLDATWQFNANKENLSIALKNGNIIMPIIGSWKPLHAHVMTLVAWSGQDGWGFANTQFKNKTITWMPDDGFTRQWNATGRLMVEIRMPKLNVNT